MVGFCTVCKIVAGQEDDVSIHRLPKDKETKANWLAFIGHETNANSGVCSKHFKESDFIYKIYGNDVRRFIKPGACPSVLQRPQNTSYISLKTESNFDLETGITIKEEIQESIIIDETLINTENSLDNQLKREIDPLAITEHNINLETNVMLENEIQEFISTGETIIDTNSMDNQLKRQTDDPLAITERDSLETDILSGNERQEPININEIINTNSIDAQLKRSTLKYKRKTQRQSWDSTAMKKAIEAMISGSIGAVKAAREFNVPQTTLERRVKKFRQGKSVGEAAQKDLGRFKMIFSEKELVNHVLNMEKRLFSLSINDFRMLAFELAEKNNIQHNFNKDRKKAGKTWYYSFLKRNPTLSLRTPEATSLARAMGFYKVSVSKFFDLLKTVYEKYNFTADRIWNVDETGVSTVPKKKSKILGLKGKKQVGKLSSAERGKLSTAVVAMSAAGNFMPLTFIFPRKKANPEFLDHAPPGSTAEFHESGWVQKDIFVSWFKKFVEFTNPSEKSPVLLLLDGHATHPKSIDLIITARAEHVTIICFPPHCTHRLQLLDVSLMAPLSTYYSQEVDK